MIGRLEPARPDDAPRIGAILSGWIDEVDWMPRVHAPGEYLDYGKLLMARTDVTVARVNGDAVGFLGRDGADIHALYIARALRGRNIGCELLNHAKRGANQLALWTFQANEGARRFYTRNGFVEDQMTDGQGNDEKIPDVHLTWTGAET